VGRVKNPKKQNKNQTAGSFLWPSVSPLFDFFLIARQQQQQHGMKTIPERDGKSGELNREKGEEVEEDVFSLITSRARLFNSGFLVVVVVVVGLHKCLYGRLFFTCLRQTRRRL
jgi:hypothetical protein